VVLVRTDVSEECIAYLIIVIRNREQLLITANGVPGSLILFVLMMEKIIFSETS
jgi:hypothetical protein